MTVQLQLMLLWSTINQVDEDFLLRSFGQFGPIASLKIHRPKTAIQQSRNVNRAHIAFMNSKDAQIAMFNLQG